MIVARTQFVPFLFSMRPATLNQSTALMIADIHTRIVRFAVCWIVVIAFFVTSAGAYHQVLIARLARALRGQYSVAVGGILVALSTAFATLHERPIGSLSSLTLLSLRFLVDRIGQQRCAGLLALQSTLFCLGLSLCLLIGTIIAAAGGGILLQSARFGLVALFFIGVSMFGNTRISFPLLLICLDTRLAYRAQTIGAFGAFMKLGQGLRLRAAAARLVWYTSHVGNSYSVIGHAPGCYQQRGGFVLPTVYHGITI
jgi:hypothetical protein